MKLKNIRYIIPAAALSLSLGLSSCVGDLDVTPIDPSTVMTPKAEELFNKCYANMAVAGNGGANGDCDIDGLDGGTTGFLRQLINSNVLTTEEAICGWGDEGVPAFNFNQWGASHPMLQGFYYRLYAGVTYCNHYLEVCGDYDATMTAEIRFLRALYYYYLTDNFGNIGFLDKISSEKAPQRSRAEMYAWIESELLDCVNSMMEPAVRKDTDAGYGRADKSAAYLLLSRLYLNAEVYTGTPQWEKAAQYAKMVMDGPHKLFTGGTGKCSSYQMLFMGDNGSNGASVEAILPLLQDGIKTTSWGTSLFLIASTFDEDMLNSQMLHGLGNGTSEKWNGLRARKEFIKKFFPNDDIPLSTTEDILAAANNDRALFYGVNHTLSADDASDFKKGIAIVKFTNYYSNGGNRHNNQFPDMDFFLMRSAEAYLTYAEATARAAGSNTTTPEGTEAINAIRSRAHAATRSGYSLNDILDERSRELYYEGYRRTDLIRYKRFGGNSDYRWEWKGGAQAGTNFGEHMNVFAIPINDLTANSNLKQNPGY